MRQQDSKATMPQAGFSGQNRPTETSDRGGGLAAEVHPTVILVDDDAAVRESLQFAFELEGYLVEAHACAETLTGPRAFPSEGCLVLDYGLPGMDGLTLLKTLRARHIDLPAVLITTQPKRSLREAAHQAGVPIIEKPLLSDALLRAVERVTRSAAATLMMASPTA